MWSYGSLKLTELISLKISSIKHNGDQRLSPDVPFSRTFSETTYGVFTPEQDNDKTNVEPVHSYDAFHTRHVGPGVKGIRNAQVQHLSCRCLALV